MFPKNEGPIDRAIRVVAGILLLPAGLFLLDGLEGTVSGVTVAIVGGLALITGATGRCVLYLLFNINTMDKTATSRRRHLAAH